MENDARLLEKILNDSSQLIQVSDAADFTMLYANEPARTYTGHAGQPFAGRHCYEYMMGRPTPCPFCPMHQIGDRDFFENEVDNGEQVFAVRTSRIDWDGRKAFIEYAWDITEIRRSQKIYESQIQTLISAIPDAQGVFHLDLTSSRIISVNGNSENIPKLKAIPAVDEMIRAIGSFIPEKEEQTEFLSLFSADALTGAYQNGEAEVRHEFNVLFDDGSIRESRITARLLMNPHTDHLECIIYGMDISREKKKEREQQVILRNALVVAERANKAKTVFLNNMSHDIRTPMNAIIGFTALAASHIDDKELVQGYLRKITTSSNHLLSLINDVLDMSRIESGRVKIEENPVHLPDVLHDLRTIIQGSIAAKQQDLYIDTQDVLDEDIMTDKLRLNQVLLNIVSNAIKFTPVNGTISIRVTEKPCSLKDHVAYEFRIKDNGIGMSREFQEQIFDSFTREQSPASNGIPGSGLGMAITKNIVDMMGGTIILNSEEGKGSEFIVTIPCRLAARSVKYGPIPELKESRALVVDDDIDTCRSVCKMLREIGMRADWTASGKESIIRAQEAFEEQDEFKAYIIDWLMPDMNGIEVVRRIRKVIGDSTPIIILTAYDWSDIEGEAREAGVTAFVSKPLFMSELRDVLSKPMQVETPAPRAPRHSFQGKRILLVEDNALNQEIATAILQQEGFVVDLASDGVEAVDKMVVATSDQYDLILMDIQMPKMDGYTATREIRTLEDNRKANIPIFAMTANAFEEDRKKAFEAGMNGHIAKPIDIEKLLSCLEEVFH